MKLIFKIQADISSIKTSFETRLVSDKVNANIFWNILKEIKNKPIFKKRFIVYHFQYLVIV